MFVILIDIDSLPNLVTLVTKSDFKVSLREKGNLFISLIIRQKIIIIMPLNT